MFNKWDCGCIGLTHSDCKAFVLWPCDDDFVGFRDVSGKTRTRVNQDVERLCVQKLQDAFADARKFRIIKDALK